MVAMSPHVSRLVRLLAACFAAFLTMLVPLSARATDPNIEKQAQVLQKKAIEEDNLNLNYAEAIKKLAIAISRCSSDKCNAGLMGTLYRDIGAMLILSGSADDGRAAFAKALSFDPSLELDPAYKSPTLEQPWNEAKKKAGAVSGGAGAAGQTPQTPQTSPESGNAQPPPGDFAHAPAAAQLVRTPLPVYGEYTGSAKLLRVIVKYRGAGMSDWKSIELRRIQTGYGSLIPCSDVAEGRMQYYFQGFAPSGDPVAASGSRNKPYFVPIQSTLAGPAPALPGEDAPKQCPEGAAPGDCPPDMPGCHSETKAGGEDCTKNEECESGACANDKCAEKKGEGEECDKDETCASGSCADGKCTAVKKAADEPCESDDQCTSGACADGKCAEGSGHRPGSTKLRKIWIGVGGSLDVIGLPASDNVCVFTPAGGNAAGYSCVDPTTGAPFPPDGSTNANVRLGPSGTAGDGIAGGFTPGNVRLTLSFDYALGMNLLVGARAGYVFLTAPSTAFAPIHLEARVSLLLGKDALVKRFAPMLVAAAGAGEFDASFPVVVQLKTGGTKNETAWITAGPVFAAVGAGARFLLGPAIAATVLVKGEGAFGGTAGSLFGFAPELGVALGF
jgi:hypothetical protein